MKTPTEYDIEQLMHEYDPAKAHRYYEEHKHLKGRKKGSSQAPRSGRTRQQIHNGAKARQKKELAASIHNLEQKLQKLEALIKKKEHEEASANRKGKAKKERAAKEKDKPKSVAEKAKAARENEKYRKKHKQELKTKAKKDAKSGGGSSKSKTSAAKHSVTELKTLAIKVKGQIAIAKAKLAAL